MALMGPLDRRVRASGMRRSRCKQFFASHALARVQGARLHGVKSGGAIAWR